MCKETLLSGFYPFTGFLGNLNFGIERGVFFLQCFLIIYQKSVFFLFFGVLGFWVGGFFLGGC